jgi:squalene synthase HpnC
MDDIGAHGSGKGHRDENFPVASYLVRACHRPVVLAFYRFARKADDIADDPTASPAEKLARLERLRACLSGEQDLDVDTVVLRRALTERGVTSQHALDLLVAFRRDTDKSRYADWAELMEYCRYSAAPVGRFMLDLHGEPRANWPASDALCCALQIINHLQDCGADYRTLDRVYVPLDALAAEGLTPAALGGPAASPALRRVVSGLACRATLLLDQSRHIAYDMKDNRLALEVEVIHELAANLAQRLCRRDPLSQRVHHHAAEAMGLAVLAIGKFAGTRLLRTRKR